MPTADVFNPLLVQKGLHSLLGVPLIRSGTLVGVMHVGTLAPRRFTAEEEELLQIAASQAAMAVQSMLSQAERTGAQELQRSLIPSELPDVPGFELAARYRPGKAIVGGDWYDVFPLPTGEIGIVMGDVAGHGLPAAVVMGRMRSALRAYALESDDPAEVLHRLNRKMLHFEPGRRPPSCTRCAIPSRAGSGCPRRAILRRSSPRRAPRPAPSTWPSTS